jgi:hypothetical protein
LHKEWKIDFTKRIDIAEGIAAFTFIRIYTVRGVIYFVAVTGRSFRHYFHMEERGGSWKIVNAPKPPDWLYNYNEELAEAIIKNQK